MKKEIAIFSILILIPISYSLETDQIESYTAQEEIKGFQIDEKSVFSVSDNYLERLDEDNYWYEADSRYTDVELSEEYVLTGTRNPGRSVYLYKRDGTLEFERMLPTWVDTLGLYNNSGTTLVGAGTTDYLALFYTDGELKSSFSGVGYSRYAPENLYNVQESENKNIAFGGGGRPTYARFQMASLDGEVEWRTEEKEDSVRGLNTPHGVLVFWRDGVSLKDAETGDPEWSRDVDGLIDPLNLSESFVYSTEDSLVFRSYEDGGVVDQVSVDEKVESLDHYPGEDLFVGYQDNNLSFFGLDGEKKGSVRFDSLGRYTRFTDFTGDGDKEIAVSDGDEIKVLEVDPDERKDSVDQELNETVFVGDSEQLFVSMALNRPVFVTEDSSSIDETVEDTGLEKLDIESINSVKSVFDVDKTSYYVGDVSKLPYVSAFAAEDNATLTFDEHRAEKDFSSKSKEELKKSLLIVLSPTMLL